jgi:hypothetical protein
MSAASDAKRKPRNALHRTSALESLRATGLVGMFAGAPGLASSGNRVLKEKPRGKAGAAR